VSISAATAAPLLNLIEAAMTGAATASPLLGLIEAVATETPAIIADVEALVARLKAPTTTPLTPQVTADTAALEEELEKQ
jgi:hypothetical protein